MCQKKSKKTLKIISTSMPSLTWSQRWFLKSFLLCWGPLIRTEGLDTELITDDPLIFAFNHNCSYETLLVPAYLIALRKGRKISFVIDWMFGHVPLIAWIFKQIDPIYVFNKKSNFSFLNHYRSSAQKDVRHQSFKVYQECIQRLNEGRSIGIFPEVTRNRDPQALLKGKKGIGYIALGSQVSVIPIGIDFPSRTKNGKIPKLGPLILRFGPKMNFSEEIMIYQQINHSPYVHPILKQRISNYLSDKVTYLIMKELARLSGKQYPFLAPIPPVAMKRFLFDPSLCMSEVNY